MLGSPPPPSSGRSPSPASRGRMTQPPPILPCREAAVEGARRRESYQATLGPIHQIRKPTLIRLGQRRQADRRRGPELECLAAGRADADERDLDPLRLF